MRIGYARSSVTLPVVAAEREENFCDGGGGGGGGGAAASSNQAEVEHAEAIRLGAPPIDDAWATPGLVGPFVLTFGLHCTFHISPIPTKC